ncbi:MAG: hypothetical protein QNJ17_17175 [Desulfocapsaceae bacterium]|nr:hypothetical protein [Desulfocapsaceae bacterium]
MQCERLIQLSKNWYLHVKDETMAPARMIQFIKNHVATCEICLNDEDLDEEIEKITELILPDSKIPKAVRMQQEKEDQEYEEEDENEDEDGDDGEDEDTEDSDEEEEEYMDDDDDLDDDIDDLA